MDNSIHCSGFCGPTGLPRPPHLDQADRVTVIFAIDFPEDDERAIAKARNWLVSRVNVPPCNQIPLLRGACKISLLIQYRLISRNFRYLSRFSPFVVSVSRAIAVVPNGIH